MSDPDQIIADRAQRRREGPLNLDRLAVSGAIEEMPEKPWRVYQIHDEPSRDDEPLPDEPQIQAPMPQPTVQIPYDFIEVSVKTGKRGRPPKNLIVKTRISSRGGKLIVWAETKDRVGEFGPFDTRKEALMAAEQWAAGLR